MLVSLTLSLAACASDKRSFYEGLTGGRDGTIATTIDDDKGVEHELEAPAAKPEPPAVDPGSDGDEQAHLNTKEKVLIRTLHGGKFDRISFLVVNAKTKTYVKNHLSERPRRLASVTKVATALASLENVKDVRVSEVSTMLKSSHNGLASKHVRLAAQAIDGTRVDGPLFSAAHSCPDSTEREAPAARAAFGWLKRQLPAVDWEGADWRDGSGCSHGNRMTARQTVRLFELADGYGKKYAGKEFSDLLSIAGVEGTWAGRNGDSRGMIFAKTGTLSAASNLAGYFFVERGGVLHPYYFAVLVEKSGDAATSRSRLLIESLVRSWISELSKEEIVVAGSL